VDPLVGQLAGLLDDADRRDALGRTGLRLVRERFSLEAAALKLDGIYRQAVAQRPSSSRSVIDTASVICRTAAHKAHDGGLLRRMRTSAAPAAGRGGA
jgi:hypothetical protein